MLSPESQVKLCRPSGAWDLFALFHPQLALWANFRPPASRADGISTPINSGIARKPGPGSHPEGGGWG